ncbi:MAG: dihydropteroate synthase [Pontiellaceae bacterium]|nr:dihydropteroate synthase [Pontiellaceae bacterium]MBN2783946.1 dihydropteroate synthase [Pontiellaceae bacterium]
MMPQRRTYDWPCRNRTLRLGERTLVMGILNVTPDSFSDGGEYIDPDKAVTHALEMIRQGADIIDIGGESTRPGAAPVSADNEIRRTAPVIEAIRRKTELPISIDTMKATVAEAALSAGADIINDVSGFEADPAMAGVAAESGAGVVLMHMKGTPRTMQENPVYADVVQEVVDYLAARAGAVEQAGVARERIVLDPGIGFGKTLEHNLALLRHLPELLAAGYPVLVGASRKRFIGQITGRENPEDRRAGSLGVAAWSVGAGAHILRVHDVIDTCDVCRMLDRLETGEP